jgi:asparagine synthase (glutamine-hydrolysing)
LPIPITDVFVGSRDTDETEWQSLVLEFLDLRERIQHEFGEEMNLLGSHVRESIRRHGLIAPAGTHMFIPTFETARGGSVLTGHGGDGLFNAGSFARTRAVLGRHERPTPRSPLAVARGIAPSGLRRAVARRRLEGHPVWLTAAALAAWKDRQAEEDASEPFRWDKYVRWWARRRYVVLCRQAAALLAERYDVTIIDPLLDPRFLAAVAQTGGALGWGRRTTALRSLFSEVLPDEVLARSTKAIFTGPYWSGEAREFIEAWDGSGLPSGLVEGDGLRAVWQRRFPDARTGLLLQAAWAATLGPGDVKQSLNCRVE